MFPSSSKPRVLLIDDAPATLRLLTAYLLSDGWEVATARELTEAETAIVSAPIDVVLVDLLESPVDRSGVCRQLRARLDPAVGLLVSADASTLVERPALEESGADDFVSKPYGRTELLLRVRSMLRMHASPRDVAPPISEPPDDPAAA